MDSFRLIIVILKYPPALFFPIDQAGIFGEILYGAAGGRQGACAFNQVSAGCGLLAIRLRIHTLLVDKQPREGGLLGSAWAVCWG